MSKNAELFKNAQSVLPGGNTRSTLFVRPHAPYAVRGEGIHVWDADGHEVIDCNNNYTALIHGHRQPDIIKVVEDELATGTAFGLPTGREIDLATELTVRMPHLDQWRFVNSGTEAVMQAIRIARAFTERDIIVRFTGSYHGTSDDVVDSTTPGVPNSTNSSVVTIPVGDATALRSTFEQHGENIAAVLLDLMPNRAGLAPASHEFVSYARSLTQQHGALLILDEVITFRMSAGGMQARYDVVPDLTTLGKVIGGGFPVGAVGGGSDVMAKTSPFQQGSIAWGGTFSANPITMVAGLKALQNFNEVAVKRLNRLGDELRTQLTQAGLKCSGSGSLIRLFPTDITSTWWKCYEAGILLGTNGLIALSTPMTEDDIGIIGTRVIDALGPERIGDS